MRELLVDSENEGRNERTCLGPVVFKIRRRAKFKPEQRRSLNETIEFKLPFKTMRTSDKRNRFEGNIGTCLREGPFAGGEKKKE